MGVKDVFNDVQLPDEFAGVFDDHLLINDCEGARSLAKEFQEHRALLSPSTLAMFDRAAATTWEQESAAKARLAALAPRLNERCQTYDAMLDPCYGMVAPHGPGKHRAIGFHQVLGRVRLAAGEYPAGSRRRIDADRFTDDRPIPK